MTCNVVVADQFFELQCQLATVGAEFEDILFDFDRHAANHFEALYDGQRVAQSHEILDLDDRQLPCHFVESRFVSFERRDGLVGARKYGGRAVDDVPDAADVHTDDRHRLTDRDHGIAGLNCRALGSAVPRAGFDGGNLVIGNQLDVGTHDACAVRREDNRAVHLRQLTQSGRCELHVEVESAVTQRFHFLVVSEDDQRAGTAAQNSFEPVSQSGTRRQPGDGLSQCRRRLCVRHRTDH